MKKFLLGLTSIAVLIGAMILGGFIEMKMEYGQEEKLRNELQQKTMLHSELQKKHLELELQHQQTMTLVSNGSKKIVETQNEIQKYEQHSSIWDSLIVDFNRIKPDEFIVAVFKNDGKKMILVKSMIRDNIDLLR